MNRIEFNKKNTGKTLVYESKRIKEQLSKATDGQNKLPCKK